MEFPKTLKTNGTASLVVETVQTHATYPWPEVAAQKDPQFLKYEADLFVLSPYKTAVQRTKIRHVHGLASVLLLTHRNAGHLRPRSTLTLPRKAWNHLRKTHP